MAIKLQRGHQPSGELNVAFLSLVLNTSHERNSGQRNYATYSFQFFLCFQYHKYFVIFWRIFLNTKTATTNFHELCLEISIRTSKSFSVIFSLGSALIILYNSSFLLTYKKKSEKCSGRRIGLLNKIKKTVRINETAVRVCIHNGCESRVRTMAMKLAQVTLFVSITWMQCCCTISFSVLKRQNKLRHWARNCSYSFAALFDCISFFIFNLVFPWLLFRLIFCLFHSVIPPHR